MANEPILYETQERVRQEAFYDGKNSFKKVNQYNGWKTVLPLARKLKNLRIN